MIACYVQGLGVWRWEAKDRAMYLPSESLGALEARFREREQVSRHPRHLPVSSSTKRRGPTYRLDLAHVGFTQTKQASLSLWASLSPTKRADVLSGSSAKVSVPALSSATVTCPAEPDQLTTVLGRRRLQRERTRQSPVRKTLSSLSTIPTTLSPVQSRSQRRNPKLWMRSRRRRRKRRRSS